MKRNLILLAVLIALLSVTWLINERGEENHRHEIAQDEMVFDPKQQGGLQSLSFGKTTLHLKGESFFVGEKKVPANPYKVEELFATLDALAAIRKLSKDEVAGLDLQLAFPQDQIITISFKTSKGITPFIIGAPLITSPGRFYARLGDQVMIVHDRKPLPMAYEQDNEADLKYRRLQTIFSIAPDFFYDTRLFKEPVTIISANFDNPRFKNFSVDFTKMITQPKSYSSLGYDQKEFDAWSRTLISLEAATVLPDYDPKLLKKLRAQLKIKTQDSKTVELSLFSGYGSLKGDFVISSLSPYLFELADNQAGLFFQSLQDFWNLTLNLPSDQLPLVLSSAASKVELTLKSGNVFEVDLNDQSISPKRQYLAVLFNLLTGRARYVSDLVDLKYKESFIIKYGNRSFLFASAVDEWLLIDSANKLAYHYLRRDYPDLPEKLEDYFGSPE